MKNSKFKTGDIVSYFDDISRRMIKFKIEEIIFMVGKFFYIYSDGNGEVKVAEELLVSLPLHNKELSDNDKLNERNN